MKQLVSQDLHHISPLLIQEPVTVYSQ